MVVFAVVLLFAGEFLSAPRNFSSPSATVRVFDQSGVPIRGLEVSRSWYDSDAGNEGVDDAVADQAGSYQFSKISANVGLFTGAWRKMYSSLGMCGSGSGTHTTISVRYRGIYDVAPKGKTLHPVGQSYQDADGVWFLTDLDSNSNTIVELSLPPKAKIIDYELSSKRHGD